MLFPAGISLWLPNHLYTPHDPGCNSVAPVIKNPSYEDEDDCAIHGGNYAQAGRHRSNAAASRGVESFTKSKKPAFRRQYPSADIQTHLYRPGHGVPGTFAFSKTGHPSRCHVRRRRTLCGIIDFRTSEASPPQMSSLRRACVHAPRQFRPARRADRLRGRLPCGRSGHSSQRPLRVVRQDQCNRSP